MIAFNKVLDLNDFTDPDLVATLNDPEVKGLMQNPENLKVLANMLRGAAAHLWWSYYRALKKREGVIGTTATAKAK